MDRTTEEATNPYATRPIPARRHGTRKPYVYLTPLGAGAAVAIAIGVAGRLHDPEGIAVGLAGFSGALPMKAWLTTVAALFGVVQLGSAAAIYRGAAAEWLGGLHRWSGRLAFLVSIPVALHCLYALGMRFDEPRVLIHSLLGAFFYGIFVTKMLLLTRRGLPGWVLPVAGGAAFTVLTGLWLTSSLWFFSHVGLTT